MTESNFFLDILLFGLSSKLQDVLIQNYSFLFLVSAKGHQEVIFLTFFTLFINLTAWFPASILQKTNSIRSLHLYLVFHEGFHGLASLLC